MTDVTPNPNARYERLLRRASDLVDEVIRLSEDLNGPSEGEGFAWSAGNNLGVVMRQLEDKVNGGCRHGGQ